MAAERSNANVDSNCAQWPPAESLPRTDAFRPDSCAPASGPPRAKRKPCASAAWSQRESQRHGAERRPAVKSPTRATPKFYLLYPRRADETPT